MPASIYGNQSGTVGLINALTAQNSTSGTSIDFTGIPAGVKRVTVLLNGVSTNGTSPFLIQIGSGSITSSGYSASVHTTQNTDNASTTGFLILFAAAAANTYYGTHTISLISGNTYVQSGITAPNSASITGAISTGSVALSGTLDRVRITTVGGTDTFDAGSINILYE